MPTDEDRRRAVAWFPLLVSLITIVGLVGYYVGRYRFDLANEI